MKQSVPSTCNAAAPTPHWVWPDVFRGLAALAVCAGHLRAALFVDHAQSPNVGALGTAFYASTGLGHQAVMVFFVLSGFLVGGAVMRQADALSPARYLNARLSRLWTVLLPALLLTLCADTLLRALAPHALDGALRATWGSTPLAGEHSLGWKTAIGNVLFLQTLAVPVFGSNGPLWSLAYEFWYYLAFPLLVLGLRGHPLGWLTLALFAAWLAVAPRPMLAGFLIWLMGVGVWWTSRQARSWLQHPASATLGLFLFILALLGSRWLPARFTGDLADQVLGLSFAFLLASCLQQRWQPVLRGLTTPFRWLSDISYSLYATHFPLVLLLGIAWGTDSAQWQWSMGTAALYASSLFVLLLAGWMVWWLTERHTSSVRQWLQSRGRPAGWVPVQREEERP